MLERQLDIQADRLAPGVAGAAVGRLHNAWTSAGGHHEAMPPRFQGLGPLRQHVGKPAGVFVVAGHFNSGFGTA